MADFSNATWRKSTHSSDGQCVEVAFADGAVGVRNSNNPAAGMVEFTPGEWSAFLKGVRSNEFDN